MSNAYWSRSGKLVTLAAARRELGQDAFRVFAATGQGAADLLEFARAYGGLGLEPETLNAWQEEQARFSELVEIWDAAVANDAAALRAIWRKINARETAATKNSLLKKIRSRRREYEIENLIGGSAAHVQLIVNERLAELATVQIDDSLAVVPLGKTLLGELYVQFAQFMSTKRAAAKCAQCGRAFAQKNSRAIYCSSACKLKAFRQKKER